MTRSQAEAIREGGLDSACLESHPAAVCAHCGCCRQCHGACGCADPRGRKPCKCGGCEPAAEDGN